MMGKVIYIDEWKQTHKIRISMRELHVALRRAMLEIGRCVLRKQQIPPTNS
jgi:hypothetical protein